MAFLNKKKPLDESRRLKAQLGGFNLENPSSNIAGIFYYEV